MKAEGRETERFEDAVLLGLKMEEWARSPGMWAAFRSWER